MLIRLFEGGAWAGAREAGDVIVEIVPSVGDLLAIADDDGRWRTGKVLAVAHRITDPSVAADIALLVMADQSAMQSDAALPFSALDDAMGAMPATREATANRPAPRPSSSGPWG